MPRALACPGLKQYRQLAAGTLAQADEDALLTHLEHCAKCTHSLNSLPDADKLANLLRQVHAAGTDIAHGCIAGLIERLSKLRPGETSVGRSGRNRATQGTGDRAAPGRGLHFLRKADQG